MRTQKQLYPHSSKVYTYELDTCLICGTSLERCNYLSGRKTVQTMTAVMKIAYQPQRCPVTSCAGHQSILKSAGWQQIAPLHGSYGFDVIATIGWQRRTLHQTYVEIHRGLSGRLQISEAQVRYLYSFQYQPLLACHERGYLAELTRVSAETGLILTLDGLAPEGGEPQLWLVRELRTGKTLRSGWMSEQGQTAFENFLGPIAEMGLRVEAVMSDKQRGLVPAIGLVFPEAKHGFCQGHYLNNIADPIARADEAMKVSLRKSVRQHVGDLIRPEQVARTGVLTITGLIPSPVSEAMSPKPVSDPTSNEGRHLEPEAMPEQPSTEPGTETKALDPVAQEQAEIVTAFKRRVRYLLTLKGRPPFRLAGIEMYARLTEVSDCLAELIAHASDPCLQQLHQGLEQALPLFKDDYDHLSQAAAWLHQIADLLDPTDKPALTGEQVRQTLLTYLEEMHAQSQDNVVLSQFAKQIDKTTHSYKSGLFHTYDISDLPRTNNDRESEFRGLNQHLLRTTGQKGATRRIIQRSGAWELIPQPDSLAETIEAISTVDNNQFRKERTRVRSHRKRFQFHTRSVKQAQKQLQDLKKRWFCLPPDKLSV
jgi:hypothetical protein